jgi:rhamnose utilization protein RhaD (predicted bifunctional aldolase and dehydrogenase)
MSVQDLVEISRYYGSDPAYVLEGGGNTSYKDKDHMWVKASGFTLGVIEEEGFVKMVRKNLNAIWEQSYPEDIEEREVQALADLNNSRAKGEESKRPSVEALLHSIFPQNFVVHTHPALVNGITCAMEGESSVRSIFGTDALWVPTVNPGYVLARAVKDSIDAHIAAGNAFPQIVFLQNHGVFVADDTVQGIKNIYRKIFGELEARIARFEDFTVPDPGNQGGNADPDYLTGICRKLYGDDGEVLPLINREILKFTSSNTSIAPIMRPYTPDHIIYAGESPLVIETDAIGSDLENQLNKRFVSYTEEFGKTPRIIIFQGICAVACGDSKRIAEAAAALFIDLIKIAVYAESFGGVHPMPEEQSIFIRNWEVEKYRAKVSLGKDE